MAKSAVDIALANIDADIASLQRAKEIIIAFDPAARTGRAQAPQAAQAASVGGVAGGGLAAPAAIRAQTLEPLFDPCASRAGGDISADFPNRR